MRVFVRVFVHGTGDAAVRPRLHGSHRAAICHVHHGTVHTAVFAVMLARTIARWSAVAMGVAFGHGAVPCERGPFRVLGATVPDAAANGREGKEGGGKNGGVRHGAPLLCDGDLFPHRRVCTAWARLR